LAIILYSNGIVEELASLEESFSERELIQSFDDYESVKSFRLSEVPNTWCLYGYLSEPPENEFNKLASEIVEDDVFSHIIFIHDSELNRDWEVTDSILHKSYVEFGTAVGNHIKEMADYIQREQIKEYEESDHSNMIFLTAIGQTLDKRILFAFNPNTQHETFESDGGWETFSTKLYEYLTENFDKEPIEENKPFVIMSDTKNIVIIEDEYVDEVIGKVIETFEKQEEYERCTEISNMKAKWYELKTLPVIDVSTGPAKKKKGHPPKNKTE